MSVIQEEGLILPTFIPAIQVVVKIERQAYEVKDIWYKDSLPGIGEERS